MRFAKLCRAPCPKWKAFLSPRSTATPKRAFAAKKRGKPYKLSGAFDKDKIARYLVLSAALFAIAAFTDYSIITLVCAGVCALLFVIASVVNIVKYVKKQRRDTV